MKNQFDIISWDEEPYLELDGGVKYAKVSVEKKYHGRFTGIGKLNYLMVYYADGKASFVGIEHFEGHFDERQGSICFEHKGIFKDGIAESDFSTVTGSGLGGLVGLNATGNYSTGHSMTIEFNLDVTS